jgi:hypothetical protein
VIGLLKIKEAIQKGLVIQMLKYRQASAASIAAIARFLKLQYCNKTAEVPV